MNEQNLVESPASEYLEYRDQVAAAVADLPHSKALAEALITDRNVLHLVYPDDVTGVSRIQVRQGHGPKSLDNDAIDTHFHAYLDTVINPQIRSGILTDGTHPGDYDDRKLRWSGAGVAGFWFRHQDIFTLEVGPTSYPRYRLDLDRHPLAALKLMQQGLEKYHDPYAYFARGIGVAVVPLTTDGSVYIGERSAHVDYPGVLNFVAGLATFYDRVEEINFYQDAQRELWEEIGVAMTLDERNTQFIGMSGNPLTGEVDLVFVVQTQMCDRYFQSGQWQEHSRLVRIGNKTEAEALLEQGRLPGAKEPKSLMFSSRFGLEYLVQKYW
ncbi:NUDIX hydrolase [Coleofasciculus chthonoplastes]|uniref:NUDIX hydrolase n=1 Tax=Coleofasciculus chthonoplastes TaxID=64178 RepID=UPI0032F74D89